MRTDGKAILLILATLIVTATTAPATDLAFTFVQVGDRLPDLQLAGPRTGPVSYLGDDDARARVFVFLKDGRDSSDTFLSTLSELHRKFSDRNVHWALIVSDRTAPDWADTVCVRCPGLTVLRDTGDELYGTLGVPLTPVVGIADGDQVLRSYLTYRKINFGPVIEAHIERVLGDIDQAELERRLSPRGQMRDTAAGSVARKLKFARMLADKQKYDPALQQIESALAEDPGSAAAYELLAGIHIARGDEDQAAIARARADSLAGAGAAEAESGAEQH